MKRKLRISIVFLSALFLFGVESLHACSCRGGANPCAFFRSSAGIAFIGTVTDVVDANEKYGKPIKGKARKITIKVDEVFKGTLPDVVVTSDDGFQCDNFPFKLGVSYLIYSKGILENTPNILPVGLCSGTSTVETAGDFIKFLRQMKSGVMPSILYGKMQRVVNGETNFLQPMARTKIVLTKLYLVEKGQRKEPKKKERFLTTVTDENGEYKFENLDIGGYKLNAALPDDLWMQDYREFGAGVVPSCDAHDLYAYTGGSLSGNVLTADGTPVRLALRLVPVDPGTRSFYGQTRTDDNGGFTFFGVNEGRDKVAIGLGEYSLDGARTYLFNSKYPYARFPHSTFYFANTFENKEAGIITLAHAQKVRNINITMPSGPVTGNISGVVVWPEGHPVDKAIIFYRVRGIDENTPAPVYAKEDGTFSIPIYEGFDYEVFASNNSRENHGSMDWTPMKNVERNGVLRIVLTPTKR